MNKINQNKNTGLSFTKLFIELFRFYNFGCDAIIEEYKQNRKIVLQ